MRAEQPTPAQVRQLPSLMQHTIPPEWEDFNGHVNIQFYMTLFERGSWPMVTELGLDVLAGTMEYVTSSADLEQRRTAAFPDDIAARLSKMIEEHRQLPWSAPLCGIMSA